ncbi:MAG: hypothetical protein U1E91_00900 [Moraxella sp.]
MLKQNIFPVLINELPNHCHRPMTQAHINAKYKAILGVFIKQIDDTLTPFGKKFLVVDGFSSFDPGCFNGSTTVSPCP